MHAIVAAIALVVVLGLTTASTAAVPEVSLPDVPVPSVPAPAAPAVPAPPVQAPSVPALPAPAPTPPAVPGVEVPVAAAPAVAVPAASSTRAESLPREVVQTGVGLAASASSPGEGIADSRDRRTSRRAGRLYGTRYRKPRELVRGLRGCLDELSPRSTRLLVLRYGVGPFEPRPAAMVARRLELTRREYRVIRRRAVRGLVRAARRSGCERQRVTSAELVSIVVVSDAGEAPWVAPAATLPAVLSPGSDGDDSQPSGGVLGRSEGGEDGKPAPTRPPAAVPPANLITPESDLPFLLALLAGVSLFGWIVYSRARRAKEALEDPSKVRR